jgi:hypothetical protein
MRSIGLPELLILFAGLFVLLVLLTLGALAIWWAVKRKDNAAGSRSCGHCGQRIPDIGTFCPICGQRLPV